MYRRFLQVLAVFLCLVMLVTVGAPEMAFAKAMGPGGGSGSGGSSKGSSSSSSDDDDCPPPPGKPDPPGCIYVIATGERNATSREINEQGIAWVPSGQYVWWGDETSNYWIDWDAGYPQYNKWIYDPQSDRILRYDFVGSSEGTYYIEDEYRPFVRKFYDKWQLEHGLLHVKRIWWAQKMGWPIVSYVLYNTGISIISETGKASRYDVTHGRTQPIDGLMYCPTTCTEQFPNPFSQSPRRPIIKNPPIYNTVPDGKPKPPMVPYPHDWLGDEIDCDNCQHQDVYDPTGIWLFGGRPVYNLFSAARGENVVIGINTLAQGDLNLPPARNRVSQVIISIEGISGAQSSAKLTSGTAQDGQWRASLFIPYGTKIGRYRVVFDIRGTNYWGQPRRKIVYAWLQVTTGETVDPGCKPFEQDCGKKVGYCGLDEDDMRRLGNKWRYECLDPKLVK